MLVIIIINGLNSRIKRQNPNETTEIQVSFISQVSYLSIGSVFKFLELQDSCRNTISIFFKVCIEEKLLG